MTPYIIIDLEATVPYTVRECAYLKIAEEVASKIVKKTKGVHGSAATSLRKSTVACDLHGSKLPRSGKRGNVHATVLESRVSILASVEPTCDTELGETSMTIKDGSKLNKESVLVVVKCVYRAPEHTHPVRSDSITDGAKAHDVRTCGGKLSVKLHFAEVDTAIGALELGSFVVKGHLEVLGTLPVPVPHKNSHTGRIPTKLI